MVHDIFHLLIVTAGEGDSVFQDEGCDSVSGEPLRDIGPFLMPGQGRKPAAGTDHDRRAGFGAFRGKVCPQFGMDDVDDAFAHLAGVHGSGIFEKRFLLGPFLGTGSRTVVKTDLLGLCKDTGRAQDKSE